MNKMIIRAIGILLIVLGVPKAWACLRTVIFVIPVGAEAGLPSAAVWSAALLNSAMVAIALGKIVGGFGLLWLKCWAKWTAVAAAALHFALLVYFGLTIWIQMVSGTFSSPANIPLWRDGVAVGVNLAIVVLLLTLFKKAKQSGGTTKPSNAISEAVQG